MPGTLEISIACLTGIILFILVVRPALAMRGISKPTETEWRQIGERILDLRRDFVDEDNFHPHSKQALKLALGREPGYVRIGHVPLALDTIQASADFVSRTYRALSAQAIIIGLLGTVVTFFTLFLSENLAQQGTPVLAQQVAQRVLGHLTIIYAVNAVAIGIATFLYHFAWRAKQRGERVAQAASEAFSRLAEGGDESLAPEMAAALDRSAAEFRSFSESLFNGQFQKIERLLGQIEGLGNGLRNLVSEVVAQNKRDQGVFQAQLRETSTSIERITQRIDQGFKLLAQPFLQGIPAMQTLAESADSLKNAAETVLNANIAETAADLKLAATSLDRTAKEMPAQVQTVLDATVSSLSNGAQLGVEAGVRAALEPIVRDWAAAVESLRTEVVHPLAVGLSEGSDRIGALTSAIEGSGKSTAEQIAWMATKLQVGSERMGAEIGSAIVESARHATNEVDASLARHGEAMLTSLLQQVSGVLSEQSKSAESRWLAELEQRILRPLDEGLRRLGEQDRQTGEALGAQIRSQAERLLAQAERGRELLGQIQLSTERQAVLVLSGLQPNLEAAVTSPLTTAIATELGTLRAERRQTFEANRERMSEISSGVLNLDRRLEALQKSIQQIVERPSKADSSDEGEPRSYLVGAGGAQV